MYSLVGNKTILGYLYLIMVITKGVFVFAIKQFQNKISTNQTTLYTLRKSKETKKKWKKTNKPKIPSTSTVSTTTFRHVALMHASCYNALTYTFRLYVISYSQFTSDIFFKQTEIIRHCNSLCKKLKFYSIFNTFNTLLLSIRCCLCHYKNAPDIYNILC